MNIELKNIKVSESLSEETVAFTASLYVDGKRIGTASNDGHGGNNMYDVDHPDLLPVLQQAEEYCKTLPAERDGAFTFPMDLELFLDNKVSEFLERKDMEAFERRRKKSMENGFVIGIPGGKAFRHYRFKQPIAEILKGKDGTRKLERHLREHVLPFLEPGEKVLNTNLPYGFVKRVAQTSPPPPRVKPEMKRKPPPPHKRPRI